MSARVWIVATLLALSACGGPEIDPKAPQTAAERARLEAAEKGELPPKGKTWGGWRYQGDRNECFFTVGRKCFKTEKSACTAAKCGKATKCISIGAAPASISCK
ncbi:MAG: hypothetical protein KBG15_24240 [Kofleriaceae bacterium]|nr:hypothetical protein [Kofleriaceae bacterium]